MELVREVRLQESADVINVTPRVTIDPGRRYLIADPSENQVRIYGRAGALLGHFGSQGSGPGEFNRVSRAVRLAGGEILTADMSGQLTVFDSVGAHVLATQRLPIVPIYDLSLINDSLLLVTGRYNAGPHRGLVHVWDRKNARVIRSFFSPVPASGKYAKTYTFAGGADVSVRGDTVAAIFALSDTVYLFRLDGREAGKIPLRSPRYRSFRSPVPESQEAAPLQEWMESYSSMHQVLWAPDGTLYVQYFDLRGHERNWSVAAFRPDGEKLWEIHDSPMLLAVGDSTAPLIFGTPDDNAGTLSIGRRRQ